MKYHYVYYSYENWGRGYIGSRTSEVAPEKDVDYLGSYYDKSFNPTNKIILEVFEDRRQALEAEIKLHAFYQVDKNQHFANKARQTTTRFICCGPRSEEFKQNLSKRIKGRKLSPEHVQKVSAARSKKLKGRKFSEEHKQKISNSLKGKRFGVRMGKRTRRDSRKIFLKNLTTGEIFQFPSISRASEATGIARSNIYSLLKNPLYTAKGYQVVQQDST